GPGPGAAEQVEGEDDDRGFHQRSEDRGQRTDQGVVSLRVPSRIMTASHSRGGLAFWPLTSVLCPLMLLYRAPNAVITGDVACGPECVIAAGAVVPPGMRVPPRSVVMGLPGRVVRPATPDEVEKTRAINARYRELARRYAAGEFPQWH